ncbi:hypothetical protein SDC9_78593 [bioreactor metagenome]|uniref:Uncharacterized protein n=1 Tax=bioreactor metagenome TaxID=1076179 RepID=A0A644YTX8_9ZZZZ
MRIGIVNVAGHGGRNGIGRRHGFKYQLAELGRAQLVIGEGGKLQRIARNLGDKGARAGADGAGPELGGGDFLRRHALQKMLGQHHKVKDVLHKEHIQVCGLLQVQDQGLRVDRLRSRGFL